MCLDNQEAKGLEITNNKMGCGCEEQNPLKRMKRIEGDYYFSVIQQLCEMEGKKIRELKQKDKVGVLFDVIIGFVCEYSLSREDLKYILRGCSPDKIKIEGYNVKCHLRRFDDNSLRRVMKHTEIVYLLEN